MCASLASWWSCAVCHKRNKHGMETADQTLGLATTLPSCHPTSDPEQTAGVNVLLYHRIATFPKRCTMWKVRAPYSEVLCEDPFSREASFMTG